MCDFTQPVLQTFLNSQETEQSTQLLKHIEKWEIDRKQIRLVRRMGAGRFGEVWEGLWNNTTSVAVKALKPRTMSVNVFLQEATMIARLHHPKLVKLHAVCTKEEPVYIVMELMKHGDLLKYLRKGEGRSLKLPQLINMASQVASGMAYLEEQNVVHTDLAAKNILVGDHMICKVCDFQQAGVLEDDIFKAPEGFKFHIQWTAPEAARFGLFTIKSDVWSFGIVLWEIITHGLVPYPGMTSSEVSEKLKTGNIIYYRMGCPPNCTQKLHNIMMGCWQKDPASRPSFRSLLVQLEDFLTDGTGYQEVCDA